ncbi:hypothetical protein [Chitinophaga sp. S165]|uniref:hypothetical protein n=1 Tax=Chitinophaga sp. S165 TaxID=2135462 RepID=UPI000D8C0AD1|nr:hypothetical protein [Chitinophaga sp. S165]PWV57013.1 hypothetical protein C7475_1011533 [Chitinophaga sp. S165]
MKILRQLACIPLLFIAQTLYGQKKTYYPPPDRMLSKQEIAREKRNHHFKRTGNETFSSRMKRYPFNTSDVVQFISFDLNGLATITADGEIKLNSSDPGLLELDTLTGNYISTVKPLSVKDVVSLTMSQIDTLTDILYNHGFAGPIYSSRSNECYSPRNAIIFRDNDGKALAFIELCFECKETRLSDERISPGEMCDEKLDMIKTLFGKVGIRYGIE